MVANIVWRGIIEKTLDGLIDGIPNTMTQVRYMKKDLHIKDESEVVFGMIFGAIIENIFVKYYNLYDQDPPQEIQKEIHETVLRRADQIREAIFKTG